MSYDPSEWRFNFLLNQFERLREYINLDNKIRSFGYYYWLMGLTFFLFIIFADMQTIPKMVEKRISKLIDKKIEQYIDKKLEAKNGN